MRINRRTTPETTRASASDTKRCSAKLAMRPAARYARVAPITPTSGILRLPWIPAAARLLGGTPLLLRQGRPLGPAHLGGQRLGGGGGGGPVLGGKGGGVGLPRQALG